MEYGIRSRGLSESGTGGADSWLDSTVTGASYLPTLAAAYQLPAGAALLLNSLQSLQSTAAAMELVWKPGKREPPDADQGNARDDEERTADDEEDEDDDEEQRIDDENEASAESWKDTPMPVLSGWMLNAYTTMLGRLSAASAALEAAENSNLPSDSESESDRSSSTDVISRESSPTDSVRQNYQRERSMTTTTTTRTKKKRTSDCKPRSTTNKSDKEASSSDQSTKDGTSTTSQGKKRSLALQRVRYEREEYRCSLCSYACTIEKAFQRHLRAHARGTATETRVSCAVCGADRSSEVDLNKHMRRHRDNRYFCCDICIFRTVQLKKLIQHRRMHTGEKPHLCPHCAYRSARRDNLRSHVRRVHKKENLYCDTFSPRGMFIAPKPLEPSEQPSQTPCLLNTSDSV